MAMGLSIGIGIPSGALTFNQGGSVDTTSFITTWRATTSDLSITIPTTGGGYNYDISTSDGRTFTGVSGNQTITFASAGDYDVSISGTFPRIFFNNGSEKPQLIDIKQWGNIVWSSFENAFHGCLNLTGSFTDAPNLTSVTSFSRAFLNCPSFNQPVNNWDVSNVTNMLGVFAGSQIDTPVFNQPLDNWDVSNVTNMFALFSNAKAFDQDISGWDITSVTDFRFFAQRATFLTTNYDAILIGWEQTLNDAFPNGSGYTPSISINFGYSKYTGGGAAATARASLLNNFGWAITDGGRV